jgi:IgGFc binding protein
MRKLLLLTFLLTACFVARSQDFSNKGKDFWIGYGNHVRMFTGTPAEKMQIYITSDVNTTGTVEIASIGFTTNFNITANQITTIDIPRAAALLNEGLYNHGIHVTALKPVVVYSFIYVNAVSGATLCLPTSTLGREYYSINYTQVSNEPNASYSYFFAVATDTGTTTIQIKPTQPTAGGRPANTPFTVNLTQGQV